jgi:hypothetical protein
MVAPRIRTTIINFTPVVDNLTYSFKIYIVGNGIF